MLLIGDFCQIGFVEILEPLRYSVSCCQVQTKCNSRGIVEESVQLDSRVATREGSVSSNDVDYDYSFLVQS